MIQRRYTDRARAALPALAWLVALAVVVWVGVELALRALGPPVVSAGVRAEVDPRAVAQRLSGRALLAGERAQEQASAPAAANARTGSLVLVGVATAFADAPGFALLRDAQGEVRSYMVGDVLPSGERLASLHAGHVELEHAGRRQALRLVRPTVSGVTLSAPAASSPLTPR